MEDPKKPVGRKMPSTSANLLADLTDILGSMRKIENTDGIVAVLIDKPLQPQSPILNGTHLWGLVDPSSADFPSTHLCKRFCIGEPREDGMVARSPLLISFPSRSLQWLHLANHQGFDFLPPVASDVDHGSIGCHRHRRERGSGGRCVRNWLLLLMAAELPCFFGQPSNGRLTDLHSQDGFHLFGCMHERHPCP